MTARTVRKLHPALRDDIGDLHTRRPLPGPSLAQIDPFLFLNHHGPQLYPPHNRGLPFGPHPHRGFETVTFILDGDIMHRDSGGHESVIVAGGVQWMTAGRGVVHEELSSPAFRERGGPLEVLQLWVNLPARLKMVAPRYSGLQKEQIPALASEDGAVTVNLIAGDWGGVAGPVQTLTGVAMMTAGWRRDGRVRFPVPGERNVFLYVVRGEVRIADQVARAFHLVEMNGDGDEIVVEASAHTVILFGHAAAIGEPVVTHGPFVMNTRGEILQAIRDYQAGRFGPLPAS